MVYTHKEETTSEDLLELISHKKTIMLEMSERFGISSEETLECSQELDELIIKYQRLVKVRTTKTWEQS